MTDEDLTGVLRRLGAVSRGGAVTPAAAAEELSRRGMHTTPYQVWYALEHMRVGGRAGRIQRPAAPVRGVPATGLAFWVG